MHFVGFSGLQVLPLSINGTLLTNLCGIIISFAMLIPSMGQIFRGNAAHRQLKNNTIQLCSTKRERKISKTIMVCQRIPIWSGLAALCRTYSGKFDFSAQKVNTISAFSL